MCWRHCENALRLDGLIICAKAGKLNERLCFVFFHAIINWLVRLVRADCELLCRTPLWFLRRHKTRRAEKLTSVIVWWCGMCQEFVLVVNMILCEIGDHQGFPRMCLVVAEMQVYEGRSAVPEARYGPMFIYGLIVSRFLYIKVTSSLLESSIIPHQHR